MQGCIIIVGNSELMEYDMGTSMHLFARVE